MDGDAGASAVEYSLLLACIAAVIIGTVAIYGEAVFDLYQLSWWS